MRRDDFDYQLPEELIAQQPTVERGESRLLHLDGISGTYADRQFRDIVGLVAPRDVVVLNDTRVIRARLLGRKQTGGRVEVMIERVLGADEALAQLGVNHPPQAGSMLILADAIEATVLERRGEFYRLQFRGCKDVFALLERYGSVPLPMYVSRPADGRDAERYQTVYAREPGAVAAPTAGLHFDQAMLTELQRRGVTLAYLTLHVGAGTFQPVRVQDLATHQMHSERYQVPQITVDAIARGRPVAVSSPSVPRRSGRWSRQPVAEAWRPVTGRPTSSYCPATAFASSSVCSPTFIFPDRHSSCWFPHSQVRIISAARTGMRS